MTTKEMAMKLIDLRESRRLSIEDVCKQIDIGEQRLIYIEKGIIEPTQKEISLLSSCYGYSLVGNEEFMNRPID